MGVAQASFGVIDFAAFSSGNTGFKLLGGMVNENVGVIVSPAKDFNGDALQDMLFATAAKLFVLLLKTGQFCLPHPSHR